MRIHIKNIVCDRCIKVINDLFQRLNIPLDNVAMGHVDTLRDLSENEMQLLND